MSMTNRIAREGLVVGLIGFAAVALFYAAFDFLAARGFLFTVNLLGQAVFYGLRDPSVLETPFPIDLTALFSMPSFTCGRVAISWLSPGWSIISKARRHRFGWRFS
jgi:hypothetical protein